MGWGVILPFIGFWWSKLTDKGEGVTNKKKFIGRIDKLSNLKFYLTDTKKKIDIKS